MYLPTIAIINFSSILDQDVQNAIRAINRQITEDFMSVWGYGRTLKLHAAPFDPLDLNNLGNERVNADSVIYLINESTLPGALGYHDLNASELPIGFVFTDFGDWTVTLSHEVLELILDPTANIFVPGPDPRDSNNWLLHTYEVCDAVESTSYNIDGIWVSNFLTSNYFSEGDALGTRNDFLGVGVKSFGVIPNSHLGVFNLETFEWEEISGNDIMGNEDTGNRILNGRRGNFSRVKAKRPCDKDLCKILHHYHEKPVKGCSGLKTLTGISRTNRYEQASKKWKILAGSYKKEK